MAKRDSTPTRPTYDEISALAYQMYEEEGRPHGRDQEHWHQAELLLMTRTLQSTSGAKLMANKSSRLNQAQARA